MLYIHTTLFLLSLLVSSLLLPYHFAIGASFFCLTQGWLFLRLSAPIKRSYFGGLAHLPILLRRLTDNAHDYRLQLAASVRRLFRGYNAYMLALLIFALIWLSTRDILLARLELPHGLFAAAILFTTMNALLIGSVQKHPLILAGLVSACLVTLCAYLFWLEDSCLIRLAYPPAEGLGILASLAYLPCGSGDIKLNLFQLLLFGGGFVSSLALLLALACLGLRASYSTQQYVWACVIAIGLCAFTAATPYNSNMSVVLVALLASALGLLLGRYVLGRTIR